MGEKFANRDYIASEAKTAATEAAADAQTQAKIYTDARIDELLQNTTAITDKSVSNVLAARAYTSSEISSVRADISAMRQTLEQADATTAAAAQSQAKIYTDACIDELSQNTTTIIEQQSVSNVLAAKAYTSSEISS